MGNRTFFGCKIAQRSDANAPKLFLFCTFVSDVTKWAGIKRIAETPKGNQRIYRESRGKAVKQYLEANPINTIPNSVLIAFSPGTTEFFPLDEPLQNCFGVLGNEGNSLDIHNFCGGKVEWGSLKFSFDETSQAHEKLALIVDGQHRILGIEQFSQEETPIIVTAILDASQQEQAFQFIVINKKSVRVETSDAKSIIADFNEEELGNRLAAVRINYGDAPPLLKYLNESLDSPFQNILGWSLTRTPEENTQLIPITAIEQSIKYVRNTFTLLQEDDDSLVEFFCAIWGVVKENYSDVWGNNSKFMTKVNIVTLNEFLLDGLKSAWSFDLLEDIFDLEAIKKQVLKILKRIPSEFWTVEWPPIKDNPNYRLVLRKDLEDTADNVKMGRAWYEGLSLPKPSENAN